MPSPRSSPPDCQPEGARARGLAIDFDARLVEEAVALAMRDGNHHADADRATYWAAREEAYRIDDEDARDRRFTALHQEWFERLRLSAPFVEAAAEQPLLEAHIERCLVAPARLARQESAELFYPGTTETGAVETRGARRGVVAMQLRPEILLRPGDLLAFLRHELFHIADMLDPAFGYDETPPDLDGGGTRLRLALDRYRVLWDTVIDGRLWRRGLATEGEIRERRRREFVRAFPGLGDRAWQIFEDWWNMARPTHARLLELACRLQAAEEPEAAYRAVAEACPLCKGVGRLESATAPVLSREIVAEVQRDFPNWVPTESICAQCAELYRNRPLSRSAAASLPRA